MSAYFSSSSYAFDHFLPKFKPLLRDAVVDIESSEPLQVEGQKTSQIRCKPHDSLLWHNVEVQYQVADQGRNIDVVLDQL